METNLYLPVKRFLENLGFVVKGEVCGCDVVAVRDDDPARIVVVELKLSFNLDLVLQAVDRTSVCDEVWVAVAASKRGRQHDSRARKLCRLIGVGLMSVSSTGLVEALVAPEHWTPRHDRKRRSKVLTEHRRRQGDPSHGGVTRQPIMTAYRQQALACAAALRDAPGRPRDLRKDAPDAPKILLRNVYGWFERVDRGLYSLTDSGRAALQTWRDAGDAGASC